MASSAGRVLVIDDSPLVTAVLEETLAGAGFAVDCAQGGQEGFDTAKRSSPDVVVCDLDMPGLSGLDVVEGFRRSAPLTPVLIFTESAAIASAVEAMRRGAFGYLTKGMSDEALLAELRKALAHRLVLERNRELELSNQNYQHELERMVEAKTKEIARLQAARAHAEKLAAMGSFVAGVAHEINNPLAVLRTNTRFLLDETPALVSGLDLQLAAEVRNAIEDMDVCSTRVQRIVEGLSRLAREDAVPVQTCEVATVLAEVKVVCGARVPASVPVQYQLDPEVEKVPMSADDLVLVLSNLVVNAAHAVEDSQRPGEVQVRVHGDPTWVAFEVHDTGCGIPKENLSRVFDPFFTTKPPGRGTGLGLSLVQQVVTNAQGEVSLTSELNQGTRVTVRLPTRR